MAFLDTIKLGFGRNLIIGHDPDKLELEKVVEKNEKDAEKLQLDSFGLFDSNQANYNTYYPEVTSEDLHPKDEEFIQPVFRALSEVIVHKDWNPVDFGENGVLKKSMSLLKGATVNVDHETAVGNAVGAVAGVVWENSYKSAGGIIIPAGINSKLKIDGKSNPKLARAIMMDPPSIHSTSVTVRFLWEKSHPDIADDQFFSKIGSYDKDSKLIRRIATEIKNYNEISLVSHGADPFAQLIKDTGIVNPKWADMSYNSLTGVQKTKQTYYFFDFKTDVISNSIPAESNNNNPDTGSNTDSNTDNMNKKFLIALAAIYGLKNKVDDKEVDYTEDTITEEVIQNHTSSVALQLAALGKRPDTTTEELTRLQGIETQYNTEKATFAEAVSLKKFKDEATTSLRVVALANYKLLNGDKASQTVIKLIEEGNYETLTALNEQYKTSLEEKFPISCKKCGSTEVNRASAEQGSGNDTDEKPTDDASVMSRLKDKAKSKHRNIAFMHEDDDDAE